MLLRDHPNNWRYSLTSTFLIMLNQSLFLLVVDFDVFDFLLVDALLNFFIKLAGLLWFYWIFIFMDSIRVVCNSARVCGRKGNTKKVVAMWWGNKFEKKNKIFSFGENLYNKEARFLNLDGTFVPLSKFGPLDLSQSKGRKYLTPICPIWSKM